MKESSRAWVAGAAIALSTTCAAPEPIASADAIAFRYISLARALALHEPSLIDHWLVDPPAWTEPRRPVRDLRAAVDTAVIDITRALAAGSGPEQNRLAHLHGQLRALSLAARRLLGESMPFDAEAALALGIEPARANLVAADAARHALAGELPGVEPLADRVARFRQQFVVPTPRRETVMRLALDQCRAAVAGDMPLPPDETIVLSFVDALPWDAHARYLGGHRTRIDVNGSRPLDLTRVLRLACHEGYAGHHAQYIWIADALIADRGWPEFALVPGFGPDLLLAEGAAEAGTDLAMPPTRRLEVYRDHLAPAAGLEAGDLERLVRVEEHLAILEPLIGDLAREYLDNTANATHTAKRLSDEALVSDPEGLVRFIEQRRTRVLAYVEGRRAVLRQLGSRGLAALPDLFTTGAMALQ